MGDGRGGGWKIPQDEISGGGRNKQGVRSLD